MEHLRHDILLPTPVASLCWRRDLLVDWADGIRVITLDGQRTDRLVRPFFGDAALQSPSGRYAVMYARFGTKTLVLEGDRIIRELNRSYYFAESYEYPITFLTHPDGNELIAHCPDECNRIEVEYAATGKRLTSCDERKPDDLFHSRLTASPGGRRLLSAGWAWHPFHTASTWVVNDVLADARKLDELLAPYLCVGAEVQNAAFIDDDRILLSSNSGSEDSMFSEESPFASGHLGVLNLATGAFENIVYAEEKVGPMLWLGDDKIVGFHETPRVFDLRTGKVIHRWPDIATGKQSGCIVEPGHARAALALDPVKRRFAVASSSGVTVIQFA